MKEIKVEEEPQATTSKTGRVFIFPTLQLNVVGFREDETVFTDLLKFYIENGQLSKVMLATGYLNLPKTYISLLSTLAGSKSLVSILTASPKANGFY